MAVLTDGHTASAAELFTCALKDYGKATIIGTKTYGKGCMQNVFELPCGGALRYTTNLFNGPTSPNFDGIGISPDITVELDSTLSQKNYFEISDSEDNQIKGAYNALKNNK
jgi:carboxyl-terminal processing protease